MLTSYQAFHFVEYMVIPDAIQEVWTRDMDKLEIRSSLGHQCSSPLLPQMVLIIKKSVQLSSRDSNYKNRLLLSKNYTLPCDDGMKTIQATHSFG